MGRELFIVSRDRPDLYRYLTQTFADADNVEVIWDRRTKERRGSPDSARAERRRGERRTRQALDAELRTVGYIFLSSS
jgi:hypothetical protein